MKELGAHNRTPINDKHRAFAEEYMTNGFNSTQAYMKVYGPNIEYDTAKVNGSKLLTHTNVKLIIGEIKGEIAAKNEINREEIISLTKEILLNNLEKSPQHSLKAIEILTKMGGLNAAEKQEIKHLGVNINYKVE